MAKELRILIAGAGQIARTTHIPALRRIPGAKLAGICDVNEEAARALAGDADIPAFGSDYGQMLRKIRPDAVMVCVPNKFHYPMAMQALEAGAHVFCEKPPGLSPEQALAMEQRAEREGKILTYGFHFRHDNRTALLLKAREEGLLGSIYHAEAAWTRRRGIPGWGVFTNREMQGGGALIDLGAHMLDLAAYLLDYPRPLCAAASQSSRIGRKGGTGQFGSWNGETFSVEDGLFGMICFEGGISLYVKAAFALQQKAQTERDLRLFGDLGGASFDGECFFRDKGDGLEEMPLSVSGETAGAKSVGNDGTESAEDPHFLCDRNFVRAALGEEEILVKAWQGTYVQNLIGMLYEAANR